MSTQAAPSAAHGCHCRASCTIPVQVPSSAVSVSPTVAVPDTVGTVSALGGAGGSAGGAAAGALTTSDAAELASPVPNASVALTTTRRVAPASSAPIAYVVPVAPVISRHASPAGEHRCHWRASSTGPLHVPSSAVSVSPTVATPVTVGAASALGGA